MNGIYSILKARFLINEDATATKNWRFIVFLIILAIVMIGNTQRFEQKVIRIIALNNEVKELRSEFVNTRSELMKLKMESTITAEMENTGIAPAKVPPVKINVDKKPEEKNLFQKILQ
jgi:Bacteriodetes cell division protein (FtsL-like)